MQVTLIEHPSHHVVELVAFESTINREAPRIYFDSAILNAKLDYADIDQSLNEIKEPILRRHSVPDTELLLASIVNKAKSDYIMNRLVVVDYSHETEDFQVGIQFNFRDRDTEHAALRLKPLLLQEYKVLHDSSLT